MRTEISIFAGKMGYVSLGLRIKIYQNFGWEMEFFSISKMENGIHSISKWKMEFISSS